MEKNVQFRNGCQSPLDDGSVIKNYESSSIRPAGNSTLIWPCRACSMQLASCHLFTGILLLIFDVITNHISETMFAITSSLSYIVCGIVALIVAKRIDRVAQYILLLVALFAFAMSVILFIESTTIININCNLNRCYQKRSIVYIVTLSISLVQSTNSLITVILCYRLLKNEYGITKLMLPYSTLIDGGYEIFNINSREMATKPRGRF